MKLLICLITYNRLAYTKRTLRDLWSTIELPYYLVIVDNASTDGTKKYLESLPRRYRADKVIINPDNYYPGKACNIGWSEGLKEYSEATHLMRLDNDMHLEKGWDLAVEDYFKKIPELGQLGLDHTAIEEPKAILREMEINGKVINPWPGCVGGPNVIKREIWDNGLRYDESKWTAMAKDMPTMQEDSKFSHAIIRQGYLMGHMSENLAWTFANKDNWSEYPDYYKKTMTERGYDKLIEGVL